MLFKQSNGLASYECDKFQKEHKSRIETDYCLLVIDLSSRVVHVIITRTLFALGQYWAVEESPTINYRIIASTVAMFI